MFIGRFSAAGCGFVAYGLLSELSGRSAKDSQLKSPVVIRSLHKGNKEIELFLARMRFWRGEETFLSLLPSVPIGCRRPASRLRGRVYESSAMSTGFSCRLPLPIMRARR